MIRSFCLIVTISLMLLASAPGGPAVFFVAQDAEGDGSATSWENAATTISAALALASKGDELWVKAGTYLEGIDVPDGRQIYGGFTGSETDPSERNPSDNITTILSPCCIWSCSIQL